GVAEFLPDSLEGFGRGRQPPLSKLFLRRTHRLLLLGCQGSAPAAPTATALRTSPAEELRRLRRSRQSFTMARHQLGFPEAELDHRRDHLLRRQRAKAVRDGADLNTLELRVDRGQRPRRGQSGKRDLREIAPRIDGSAHFVSLLTARRTYVRLQPLRTSGLR